MAAFALGIDMTPVAVETARARGADALRRSVFERIPGAGRWGTALLLDGNVGIGGDPAKLLRRVRSLLRAGGRILLEGAPPGTEAVRERVRLEIAGAAGPWFDWRAVAVDELDALAARLGFQQPAVWCDEGRWFAQLDEPGTP